MSKFFNIVLLALALVLPMQAFSAEHSISVNATGAAGALTLAGSFGTTFTVTGTTGVTLPTSGTLVNSAVTSLSSLATVGTITSGVWNAGAVTSSGAFSGLSLNVTGSSVPTNGVYLPAATTLGLGTGSGLRMWVSSTGVVVINGTVNTTGTFASATPNFQVLGVGTGSAASAVGRYSADAVGPVFNLGKTRGASIGTNTVVNSGDALGTVRFSGGDGTNIVLAGEMRAEVDGTPGTTDMPTRLVFLTARDGTATLSEAMRLDNKQLATFAGGTVSGGTKFTTSGCSISATTGGATAGTFTLGANSCTAVITMNGATAATAPNGWQCSANDRTAPTILIGGNSASSTTTASFTIPAGAGTTDVIGFSCTGY